MTHDQLLKLGQFLGYALEEGGLCSGFTNSWIRANCLDDLKTFYARLNLLDKYKDNPQKLKEAIDNNDDPEISAEERELLSTIKPFFGIIALYQAPERYKNLFMESKSTALSQSSRDMVSVHTESLAITLHENFVEYDKPRLIGYLYELSKYTEGEVPLSIYMGSNHLSSGSHAIGIRILDLDQFEYINTNASTQSTEIRLLFHRALFNWL